MSLAAPFPWFGGKSRAAAAVWAALGDVPNYVEPFAGSLAVLLSRPSAPGIETVNDKDGFIANVWRAITTDPDAVAHYADWPVNENDLHARHSWLVARRDELTARLEGDPDYCDAQIAGWWLWGICCWIGGGWCSGQGPWHVVDGKLVHLGDAGQGVNRTRVHLGNAGQGVNRKRVHLGDAGHGVNRTRVHLGNGQGVNRKRALSEWMYELSERLRRVRVCCGDWTRVLGPTPTVKLGLTGVVLDPPYDAAERADCYSVDEAGLSAKVRTWAIGHGDDTDMRIVLCGYEGEHDMPDSWRVVRWKAHGGYGRQGNGRGRENAHRETLWCSPHCLVPADDPQQCLPV